MGQPGPAVFPRFGGGHISIGKMGDVLGPVTDGQDGDMPADLAEVRMRGLVRTNRGRRSGKDHRLILGEVLRKVVKRLDFTENVQFPDASSDQLGVLGTKIEDQDVILHGQK